MSNTCEAWPPAGASQPVIPAQTRCQPARVTQAREKPAQARVIQARESSCRSSPRDFWGVLLRPAIPAACP
ncbi:hypothetical protein TIFTF001_055767 [Ficus carica]|uniref:Uncharacterized protein n=1 Tax=Ficus carica TaxID=3494 RepID=A0AA88EIR4_FICCA|nr:hypothetical protein TIFTF001_055767 [Ficus carica]